MGEVSWWTIPVPSLAILVSAVLVLSCGQTDRITEADQRYTHATTVGRVKTFLKRCMYAIQLCVQSASVSVGAEFYTRARRLLWATSMKLSVHRCSVRSRIFPKRIMRIHVRDKEQLLLSVWSRANISENIQAWTSSERRRQEASTGGVGTKRQNFEHRFPKAQARIFPIAKHVRALVWSSDVRSFKWNWVIRYSDRVSWSSDANIWHFYTEDDLWWVSVRETMSSPSSSWINTEKCKLISHTWTRFDQHNCVSYSTPFRSVVSRLKPGFHYPSWRAVNTARVDR